MGIPSHETRGRPKDAAKREAIMEAAKVMFMERGFSGTSMDGLARAAAVSKATLYSHFADKDALYRAIIESKVIDYQLADFTDRLSGDMERDLQLIANDMQNLIFDDEAVRMLRMVIAEAQHQSPIVALFEESGPKRVFTRIADYFAALKAQGSNGLGCPEREAELFTGLVMGHRRVIQILMGVEKAPTAAARKQKARDAVTAFLKLKRD
ncbi:MAG: TetR/AcrR family transcriptional regulator [Alphaproteobacteria bacterium]|nr:TetR/AcrR family transcriptional regulator [Alphaproteobacteria bacterium]